MLPSYTGQILDSVVQHNEEGTFKPAIIGFLCFNIALVFIYYLLFIYYLFIIIRVLHLADHV